MNPEKWREIKARIRTEYKKTKSVYCPCLGEDVMFNADGFRHLFSHVSGKRRIVKEQMYKLVLFPLAKRVIAEAKKVDIHREKYVRIRRKKSVGEKKVEYWALSGCVDKRKIVKVKVILRRVGDGNVIFWSIMRIKKQKTP